jgi:hypothetical protein
MGQDRLAIVLGITPHTLPAWKRPRFRLTAERARLLLWTWLAYCRPADLTTHNIITWGKFVPTEPDSQLSGKATTGGVRKKRPKSFSSKPL